MTNSSISTRAGATIRLRRLRLRMTIDDLGERSNRHPTFVGQVERGGKKASLETFAALARALDMPLSDVFRGRLNGEPASLNLVERISSLLRSNTAPERIVIESTVRRLSKDLKTLR